MGYVLGIDLASRYSAAVLLAPDGAVLLEEVSDFGAADVENPFPAMQAARGWTINIMTSYKSLTCDDKVPLHVVVEDLSHHMVNPKPAIRAQAAVLLVLGDAEVDVKLVYPVIWQNHHGFKRGKDRPSSKVWAKARCAELGYELPAGTKGKASVDLRDAYLIARWRHDVLLSEDSAP